MNQLGWIDFSRTHRDKVMLVMDLFQEQGMIDELGLGTIRDSLSDILFPGTSTIQTKAKYFLLIPWIIQDIERRGKIDRFHSELEEAEVQFVKVLRSTSARQGIIGATLPNANPKRKPSSIYWNGLRTYGILNFKGSISDYTNYIKYHHKKAKERNKQISETDGNVPGDDRDANHLYQQHLWSQLPQPGPGWKENLKIELSYDEADFLRKRITLSNPTSLWAYTLKHLLEKACTFSGINDFLSIRELPDELKNILQLAIDFNNIMQGALIRYNYLIQTNRNNGKTKELSTAWDEYCKTMKQFNWNSWNTEQLWKFCPFTQFPTKRFVESWMELMKAPKYDVLKGDQLIKDRELKLKSIRRARLQDKAIAQKQENLTGIAINEFGVQYLTYRWNTVKTFLNDIHNGLASNVTAQ